jgi:molybdate transport system regulatory protein
LALDRVSALRKIQPSQHPGQEPTAMPTIKLKLQVLCGEAIAMGPGKADLLERIIATGSIAGAARDIGMSYRRAWQLVDVMNRCWQQRLVETTPGRATGGARVTDFGRIVVTRYRALQRSLDICADQNGWHDLSALIRETPLPQHSPDQSAADCPASRDGSG